MSSKRRPKTKRSVPMRVPNVTPRLIETVTAADLEAAFARPEQEAEIMRAIGERFDEAVIENIRQSSRAIDPDGLSGFNIDHIVGVGETMSQIARHVGASAGMFGNALNQIGQAAARGPIRMLPVPEGVPTYRDVEAEMRRRVHDAMGVDAAMMAPTPRAPPAKPKPVQPGAPTSGKRKLNLGDD